jgi:hypothetical protein
MSRGRAAVVAHRCPANVPVSTNGLRLSAENMRPWRRRTTHANARCEPCFNLTRPEEYGRADVDAVLELRGRAIPAELCGTKVLFELKSATAGRPSISTVRDFGLHHIEKWRPLHRLVGVYARNQRGDQVLQYCLYGSPQAMAPWFDEKASYIAPDVALGENVPNLITDRTLTAILGAGRRFSRDDARRLMKNQYGAQEYEAASGLAGGSYSRVATLRMLRERCRTASWAPYPIRARSLSRAA